MIVLDTHALVWWRTDNRQLSLSARRAIERESRIIVPDVVCFEVAMLVHRGRIRLGHPTREWLELALAESTLELAPVTPEIAVAAAALHQVLARDPSDAIIAATALRLGVPLVTRDSALQRLGGLETIW